MNIRGALHWLNRRDHRVIPKISPVFKFLFAAIIVFGCSALLTKIKAQEAASNLLEEKQDAINAGSNNERWTKESIASQATVFVNASIGEIPKGVFKGEQTSFVPGGMVGSANQMIAALYTPQASGIEYIARLKNNLLGKPAYAQGFGVGFNGLQPILPLWRGFRNVVYIMASFLFVVIGIMIMLRVKVSPQAVITIQSAIPKVIITLLLVTFSYAIAGLLIDASLFLQSFGLAVLYQAAGKTNFSDNLLGDNKADWTFQVFSKGGLDTISRLTYRMVPAGTLFLLGGIVGAIVLGIAFPSLPGVAQVAGFGLGGILILIVFCIFIMIWQIKFYFGLIKCYVNVLFKIIMAPLEIGLGAFPNMKIGFSSWLLQLVANLSVFPISLLFLVLANLLIEGTKREFVVGSPYIWIPQMLESGGLIGAAVNLATYPAGGLLPIAIGLVAMMLLSKLPDMIPQYVFMIKPSPWGSAVGEGMNNIPIVSGAARSIKASGEKEFGGWATGKAKKYAGNLFGRKTKEELAAEQAAAGTRAPTNPPGADYQI